MCKGYENSEFDTIFYEHAQAERVRLESVSTIMNEDNMNQIIFIEEESNVLNKMCYNKAVGIDNWPYEELNNTESSLSYYEHNYSTKYSKYIVYL